MNQFLNASVADLLCWRIGFKANSNRRSFASKIGKPLVSSSLKVAIWLYRSLLLVVLRVYLSFLDFENSN